MKIKSNPILITGSHRSGTTWVGNVVNSSDNTVYLWEPFNFNNKKAILNVSHDYWFKYLHQTGNTEYYKEIQKTVNLNFDPIRKLGTLTSLNSLKWYFKTLYAFIEGKLKDQRVLFKDPIAFFSIEWLVSEFDFKPVILIRHPAAFVSSLKRLHWEFDFNNFLNQDSLIKDKLLWCKSDIEKHANNSNDIIGQAILLWKIFHYEIDKLKQKYPEWFFIKHEELSINPIEQYKRMFDYLDLKFSNKVVQYIEKTTKKDINVLPSKAHELKRNSKESIKNWKKILSKEEVEYIYNEVKDISSLFYKDSEW